MSPLPTAFLKEPLLTNAAEKVAKTDEIGKTTGDIKGTMQAVVLSTAGILFSTPALAVSCTVLFADSLLKSSWTLTKLTGSGTFDVQALPNGLRMTIHAGGGSACVAHTRPSGGRLRSSGHPNGRLKLRANVPSLPACAVRGIIFALCSACGLDRGPSRLSRCDCANSVCRTVARLPLEGARLSTGLRPIHKTAGKLEVLH
ncbi:hypothetical protein AWB66_06017 [Caballeronia telluris]|uniref:Uncharacterized protein n=1 Tax=Caballeronia telluris TaxID=326475 RepID=A0A158KDQ0_9BURK|nr:hypothetical protein AWB66_06017 [Caballeronia telluris]